MLKFPLELSTQKLVLRTNIQYAFFGTLQQTGYSGAWTIINNSGFEGLKLWVESSAFSNIGRFGGGK